MVTITEYNLYPWRRRKPDTSVGSRRVIILSDHKINIWNVLMFFMLLPRLTAASSFFVYLRCISDPVVDWRPWHPQMRATSSPHFRDTAGNCCCSLHFFAFVFNIFNLCVQWSAYIQYNEDDCKTSEYLDRLRSQDRTQLKPREPALHWSYQQDGDYPVQLYSQA